MKLCGIAGDNYSPYNRPKALMMWMADINPPEEWILILDPDMVLRSPLTPSTLQIPEGFVSAAHCTYLTGRIYTVHKCYRVIDR